MSDILRGFTRFRAITKSDSTVLSENGNPPDAIFVGTAGNVNVQGGDLVTSVLFKNIASGTVLWVSPARVMSTSTTAADMVACWR